MGADFYFVLKPSVFESARSPDFASLPIILEDWIKDNSGTYSGELHLSSYSRDVQPA